MKVIVGACIMLCAAWASFALAADSTAGHAPTQRSVADQLGQPHWGRHLSAPLCGVYAACTAVELVGLKADPRDFVTTRYVGRCGGSSPQELERMVEACGARASTMSRLSVVDLRLMESPIIAYVRPNPDTDRFNHWVTALPSGSHVMIFDELREPFEVSHAEFLGVWSGIGICVTRDGAPLSSVWWARASLLLPTLILAVVAVQCRWFLAIVAKASVLKQVAGLFGASLIAALAGNFVFGDPLHHGQGVAAATAASQQAKYRVGTLDDARKASVNRDALLVDARRERDYRLGTIDGAVNIPVTASVREIDQYVKRVHRSTPIVVFCQSASCGYDETVAKQLVSLGFANVTVCDEGWREYDENSRLHTDAD